MDADSNISRKQIIAVFILLAGLSGLIYPILADQNQAHNFKSEQVLFELSQNRTMEGLLYIPDSEGPFPVVYFGAGSGADPIQYSHYGDDFARQGFLTLIHGPSRSSTSFPSKVHWEIVHGDEFLFNRSLREDINVLSQLESRHDTDSDRIVVGGHSGGANGAYRIALEKPDVSGVIAIAGRFPPENIDELETNLLLATGGKDTLVPPEKLEDIAFNVTGKHLNRNEVAGDFKDNNATKIFVSESSGHLTEAFDDKLIEESVRWALYSAGNDASGNINIETKSSRTVLLQFLSGIVMFMGAVWLSGSYSYKFNNKRLFRFLIPVIVFVIFYIVLLSTISRQFIQLEPAGCQWFQYLLIGVIASTIGVAATKLSNVFKTLNKKEFAFDLFFLLITCVSFVLISTQFVIFQLVTSVVLGSLLFLFLSFISLLLWKSGMDLRQRLIFNILAVVWLLPVLVPPY